MGYVSFDPCVVELKARYKVFLGEMWSFILKTRPCISLVNYDCERIMYWLWKLPVHHSTLKDEASFDLLYVLSNLQFMRYVTNLHVKSVWSHSSMEHSFCFFKSLIVSHLCSDPSDFTDCVLTEVVNNKDLGPTCAIVCYPRVLLTRVETSTNINWLIKDLMSFL